MLEKIFLTEVHPGILKISFMHLFDCESGMNPFSQRKQGDVSVEPRDILQWVVDLPRKQDFPSFERV